MRSPLSQYTYNKCICHVSSKKEVKAFMFWRVIYFPNPFFHSYIFIWEFWLKLEWWAYARHAFIWNTVDMTSNSLYFLLLVFIRLWIFGSLPILKRQEMGVSKIWHSFLWKEGRESILLNFSEHNILSLFFYYFCVIPLYFSHLFQLPIWLLWSFLIREWWRGGSTFLCIRSESTTTVWVCGSAFSVLQGRLWTVSILHRWDNTL